jgi:hypothetical protein
MTVANLIDMKTLFKKDESLKYSTYSITHHSKLHSEI